MTISQLKKLLFNSIFRDAKQVGLFHLDFSTAWNESISQLAENYFPEKKFSFHLLSGQKLADLDAAINQSTESEVVLKVVGIAYPFNNLPLSVIFNIKNGKVELIISASVDNPTLSTYLPVFENTLADSLSFDSLTFELNSGRIPDDEISSLNVYAKVNLEETISGFNSLLGLNNILEVTGPCWLEKGGTQFFGIRLFANERDIEKEISVPGFTIKLKDFGIMDETVYSFIKDTYSIYPFLVLDADLEISANLSVPIGVEIANLNSDIHFKADLNNLEKLGLEALEGLLGLKKGDFSAQVPESLRIADQITLEEFGLYYNPSSRKVTRIYGGVRFNADFPIFDDISVKIIGFQFNLIPQGMILGVELDGEIEVGNGFIEIQLKKSATGFGIAGWLKESSEINLSEIIAKFADGPTKLPNLAIGDFDFSLSREGGNTPWSFDIELKGNLPIPFQNPAFTLSMIDFYIDSNSTIQLRGVFSVGTVNISLSADKQDKGWKFEGSTGANQEIPFGEFIELLWNDLNPSSKHKIPDAIGHLVAENIDLVMETSEGFSFTADMEISASKMIGEDFEVTSRNGNSPELLPSGSHDIQFENIVLHLERAETILFTADAKFDITVSDINNNSRQIPFNVNAAYNEGWEFKAEMDGTITLSELINKFAPSSAIPSVLSTFSFGDLIISFNTKSGDKYFSGKGEFQLPDGPEIDLVLNIDISNSEGGEKNTNFSGQLVIIPDQTQPDKKFDFDVLFKKSKADGQFLLAAYHQEATSGSDPAQIDIGQLLQGLGVPDAPSMDLTLQDAFFVNEKKADEQSINLLVADIAAGMNISNLPLVGKILPKDATVSLALRVLYASAPYAKYVDQVNGVLPQGISPIAPPESENNNNGSEPPTSPPGQKPANAGKELELIAQIDIGEQTFNLDLPIKIKPKKGNTSPGNNNKPKQEIVETKPETDTTATTDTATPSKPSAAPTTPGQTPVPVNDGITWFKIGKTFGPVVFNRLGITYKNQTLTVYPDAALSMAGLTFTLNGLSVSSSIKEFKPIFALKGLGLDFAKGPIEIGASFLRRPLLIDGNPKLDKLGNPVYEYDGMATIKTDPFSISALGSYAYVDDHASLFIYAYLDQALGGPAFFYVEGLAAAFGYNRSLLMPTIDQVSMFPLVRQVMAGQAPDETDKAALLTQQLDALSKYIPPDIGQMFIAIGVKFNSFKLLDSFALLAVSFGNYVEIDLLGQTNIIVPSEVPPDVPPLAEIKIQLLAKIIPEEGFLGVQAQLTKDSYVLSKDCHLTGGAAFYSWFSGDYAGDFVVTMGGYHPAFNVPAHYPKVPRLGVNWQVVPELSIKGDMYFALCAHAFMAGGHLEALYESGPLKAWFKAGADFLISWQPYHYDARIYIDLGASYTYQLFGTHTITLDLGADVHIWGPEFAGTASIHILIFEISVAFGPEGSATPDPITWDDFKKKCLPDKKELSGVITHGQHGLNENKNPIVNPKELKISVSSPVPVNEFVTPANNQPEAKGFAIAPMEVTSGISSKQTVTITKDGNGLTDNEKTAFQFEAVRQKLPAAIWGNSFTPALNTKDKTIELVTGVTITTNNELPGESVEFEKHPQEQDPFNCKSTARNRIIFEPLSPELSEDLGIKLGALN